MKKFLEGEITYYKILGVHEKASNNELRNIDTNNFKEKFILRLPIRRGYILDITKNARNVVN